MRLILAVLALTLVAAPAAEAACGPAADRRPTSANRLEAQRATLCLVNAQRTSRGLPKLRFQSALQRAAVGHSRDMDRHDYFSHTGRDGRQPWDRARRAGYPSGNVGENIAIGYRTPRAVVRGWMRSSGHRANILRSGWREAGLGIALGGTGRYPGPIWTNVFGARG